MNVSAMEKARSAAGEIHEDRFQPFLHLADFSQVDAPDLGISLRARPVDSSKLAIHDPGHPNLLAVAGIDQDPLAPLHAGSSTFSIRAHTASAACSASGP